MLVMNVMTMLVVSMSMMLMPVVMPMAGDDERDAEQNYANCNNKFKRCQLAHVCEMTAD